MTGMNLSTYINMLRDGANIVSTEDQNVSRYAMIKDSVCIGVTLWNGDTNTWRPLENVSVIKLEDNSIVGPGWIYDNQIWVSPPPISFEEIL